MAVSCNSYVENDIIDVQEASFRTNDANCCCPPRYHPTPLEEDDPGAQYDINGDGWICYKDIKGNGHGNDPLYEQSSIKDNNQPCHIDNKIPNHNHSGPCE